MCVCVCVWLCVCGLPRQNQAKVANSNFFKNVTNLS